jgi:hypothetical protein
MLRATKPRKVMYGRQSPMRNWRSVRERVRIERNCVRQGVRRVYLPVGVW